MWSQPSCATTGALGPCHCPVTAYDGTCRRHSAAMAYDSVNLRLVMFGGSDSASHVLGDTWSWGRRVACDPLPGSEVTVGSEIHCVFEPGDDSQFVHWSTEGFVQDHSGELNARFHTLRLGQASITADWIDQRGMSQQTAFSFTVVTPRH